MAGGFLDGELVGDEIEKKNKPRLNIDMDTNQILDVLSDRNLRDLLSGRNRIYKEILVGISKATVEIDPCSRPVDVGSMGKLDFMSLIIIDRLGLYGAKISALHCICGKDFEKTAAVLRGWSIKVVSGKDLLENVETVLKGGHSKLDVDDIVRKVQDKTAGYKTIVPNTVGKISTASMKSSLKS